MQSYIWHKKPEHLLLIKKKFKGRKISEETIRKMNEYK